MEQKVVKIGNSVGIIIPVNIAKGLGLKQGMKVYLDESQQKVSFTVSKRPGKLSSITPEFLEIIAKVNKHYGQALKALANK